MRKAPLIHVILAVSVFSFSPVHAKTWIQWVDKQEQIQQIFNGDPLVDGLQAISSESKNPTKIWVAATDEGLIFRFSYPLVAPASRPKSAIISITDVLGMMIDVQNDDATYHMVEINREGIIETGIIYAGGLIDSTWKPKIGFSTSVDKGVQVVTVKVPFKALDAQPARGDVFGFNFFRRYSQRDLDKWPVEYAWSVARAGHCSVPYDPMCFNDVTVGAAEKLVQVESISRGGGIASERIVNVFRGRMKSNAASRINLEAMVIGPKGRSLASKKFYAEGKRVDTFDLPYPKLRGPMTVTFRVEGRGVDNPVYESKYLIASDPGGRVLTVEKPAGRELYEWRTFPHTVYGAPLLLQEPAERIAKYAERLGIPWNPDDFFAVLAENRFSPVVRDSDSSKTADNFKSITSFLKRSGLKGIANLGETKALEANQSLYWGAAIRGNKNESAEKKAKDVKSCDPRIVTILGEKTPFDGISYSRMQQNYDGATLLLNMPEPGRFADSFGFKTKLLADLSGMKEIWVGASSYGFAEVGELRQMLSSAVRCGATGLVVSTIEPPRKDVLAWISGALPTGGIIKRSYKGFLREV